MASGFWFLVSGFWFSGFWFYLGLGTLACDLRLGVLGWGSGAGGTELLRLGEPLAGAGGTGGLGSHCRVIKKPSKNPLGKPS